MPVDAQTVPDDPRSTEAGEQFPGSLEPGPNLKAGNRRRRLGLLGSYLATVIFLITINFFLPRAMPGNPVSTILSERASANPSAPVPDKETKAKLIRYYGLDRPVVQQYFRYLGGLATGDLGTSIGLNRPVATLIRERFPWTLLIAVTSVAIATMVGAAAGIHSGWHQGRRIDRGLLAMSLAVRNIPAFFLGSLALFFFAVKLKWVPVSGAVTAFSEYGPLARLADVARHLALPALVVALPLMAGQFLVMRGGMVSELGADYLLMGRAKGMPERRLKYRYAARNALLPLVAATAVSLGFSAAAGAFVETLFAYPGLGQMTFQAAQSRDYPLMQGCFLILTLSVVSLNFAADLINARLDPRTAA